MISKNLALSAKLLAGVLAFAPAASAQHGPIFQWHANPCTTIDVHWIAAKEGAAAASGTWRRGPAGFGYGDNDDQTVLDDMQGSYRSVYIRSDYEIPPDAPEGAELWLSLRYDDAFVAYLDGEEVTRRGVTGSGAQASDFESHEADVWERFSLGTVKAGQSGTIALEGHNEEIDSSDFTLRPRLDLRAGNEVIPIIQEGAEWEYLAGASPRAGWAAPAAAPEEAAPRPRFEVAYRPAKRSPRAPGESWEREEVHAQPFGPSDYEVHTVALSRLTPGTRYECKIAHRGALWGTWFFETAPPRFEEGMTFVTGGDMFHTRPLLDAMNKRAGAEAPLFALLGGDLAYANGTDSSRWVEWLDSWNEHAVTPDGRVVPMIVAIGNHEVKGAAYRAENAPSRLQAPYYYSLFAGQEQGARDTIDFSDYLSIITLDSGHSADVAAQTDWLGAHLEARGRIPRLFVCYHRPAYGTGVKSDALAIRRAWAPLFEKHQVDAVFENDHHVYKRTHPIRNGKVDQDRGVIYIGDGSWGVRVRAIAANWKETRPWLAEAKSLNHLIKVTMTRDGFRYEAMQADGTVIDESTRPLRR